MSPENETDMPLHGPGLDERTAERIGRELFWHRLLLAAFAGAAFCVAGGALLLAALHRTGG